MKPNHSRSVIFFGLLSITLQAPASSDQEIISFAKQICDEISDEGTIRKEQIEGSIKGKVSGLARLLGGSLEAGGKLIINETEYKGLPYHELPAQMKDARSCRRDLAILLINERQEIENNKSHVKRGDLENAGVITQLEIEIYRIELELDEINKKINSQEQNLAKRNEIVNFLAAEKDKAESQGRTEVASRFAEQLKQTLRHWDIPPYSQEQINERDTLTFELKKKKELLQKYSD